jgi:hypothetical protein
MNQSQSQSQEEAVKRASIWLQHAEANDKYLKNAARVLRTLQPAVPVPTLSGLTRV